tara:strand:- start:24 stop:650 length:627 start_codon:yes stop_codon:yes gene_type:complete
LNRYPEYSKKYYEKNKEKILTKHKEYYEKNKEVLKEKRKIYDLKNRGRILKKQREYQIDYKKNNKKKVLESQRDYYTSERGYFVSLWGTINRLNGRKKWKTVEEKNGFKDFDEFYNHWLEQKSIYGMKCPATGIEMTTKRYFNKPGERKDKCMTNISVDRILSSRNYSPQNLMFTTWQYNMLKGALSPKAAKTFLRIVKERYGTDDLE